MGFARGAAEIALEAGELLRGFFERGVAAEYKGKADLVTVADRSSERLITGEISRRFPDHGILGEEGTRRNLEREFRWYVDPLDGTTNFAHGFPFFAVSLGLERRAPGTPEAEDGELVAGIVYDPLRREMFAAELGKGAWLNGRRIHPSRVRSLGESLLSTGFPSRKRHQTPNIHFYQQLSLRSHGVRRAGSAALDLAFCASGRLEAFWEFNLNSWDTAAGALLVTEAGGRMTRYDGSRFRLDSKEVMATNGLVTDELIGMFADIFAGRNLQPAPTPAQFAAGGAHSD